MRAPKFTNPPVNEVVCGVQFSCEKPLQTVDFGQYWHTVRHLLPHTEEHPPIAEWSSVDNQEQDLALTVMPPLRRVWLMSGDDSRLIQLQEDRFYYNWRRRPHTTEYPSFDVIEPEFQERWTNFVEWCARNGHGTVTPQKCELTYQNHIDMASGWQSPADTARLLNIFSSIPASKSCLSNPSALTGRLIASLPDKTGTISVHIKQATNPQTRLPLLVLEIQAKSVLGMASEKPADIRAWFQRARQEINEGFVAITTELARTAWGYK